jgi:hypothetical protein
VAHREKTGGQDPGAEAQKPTDVVAFEITDLFVVGLGFDLVGAWLLARGLVAKPGVIVHRHMPYWGDGLIDPVPSFAAAEDRIDGRCGVGALLCGFGFQALGYVLDLAVGGSSEHSGSRAATAGLLLAVAIAVAAGAWWAIRGRLLRTLLVEMARWDAPAAIGNPVRHQQADPAVLVRWEFGLRVPRRSGEDDPTYAKRVFGVSDADLEERHANAS